MAGIDYSFWDWVENFIKKCPYIGDVNILQNVKDLTEEDKINLRKIRVLFSKVQEYATMNYISLEKKSPAAYYTIKKSDSYYDIGYARMGSDFVYFIRVNNVPASYIDYAGIEQNERRYEADIIPQLLEQVKGIVIQLESMGLSTNDIFNYINNGNQKTGK